MVYNNDLFTAVLAALLIVAATKVFIRLSCLVLAARGNPASGNFIRVVFLGGR